ncbi:MAG: mechanosensitive ion channel family protein [Pseudomonadota bacterium]
MIRGIRPIKRSSLPLVAAAALLAFCAVMAALPTLAQSLTDYGTLTQSTDAETETTDATPVPATNAPDLEAYGRIDQLSPGAMIDTATRQVDIFQQRLRRIVESIPDSFDEIASAMAAKSPDGDPLYFVGVAIFLAILLIIGRAGGLLFAVYVARPIMVGIQRPHPRGLIQKLPVLATRVAITVAILIIMILISLAVGAPFFDEHAPTSQTGAIILGAFVSYVLIDTTWRMILSPYLPNYRVPHISDGDAIFLYRYFSVGTLLGITTMAIGIWLDVIEVKPEVVAFFRIVAGTLTTGFFVLLVVRNRRAITGAILAGRPRAVSSWITSAGAFLWLPAVIAYLIIVWLEQSFDLVMGLLSPAGLVAAYSVFLVSIVLYAVLGYIVELVFSRARQRARINADAAAAAAAEERRAARDSAALTAPVEIAGDAADVDNDGDEEGGGGAVGITRRPEPLEDYAEETGEEEGDTRHRRGMHTYEDLAHRAASLFAIGVGGFVMIRVWIGAEIFEESSAWNVLQDVLDTAFFGYLLYHALRIWMDRRIAEEGVDESGGTEMLDEGAAASATSRLGTLLPLIRSFVLLVVAASVFLLIAARLGVNVAPLFAGAGIVGLAIGFGAQTLVRDILSGVFYLLDDAFRRGEYIDVGSVKGTVEKISIRSFQLRHHLGALHTIPFGEIQFLTNYSRDWVIMKLPLRLTYDTDVEKVRKIIKKLGNELLEHPLEGHKFVQPLKSQGVYMMEDSAMIVRVKFMTRPGDQWTTRKLAYQRIREVFEKEGIKFAHREVTVRIPDIEKRTDLDEADMSAIGAAARRAVDEVDALAGPQPALADGR